MFEKMNKAFTILEIATVVSIIALLMIGVTVGQELAKNANLRALASEQAKYIQAVKAYRLKFQSYPGDDATYGWQTGNNDNRVTFANGANSEALALWARLADRGFIEGNYIGYISGQGMVAWKSVPGSKYRPTTTVTKAGGSYGDTGFVFRYLTGVFGSLNQHFLTFGARQTSNPSDISEYGAIGPVDAKALDIKIDNGDPTTGDVMAFRGNEFASNDCTNAANINVVGSSYFIHGNAKDTEPLCRLFFAYRE